MIERTSYRQDPIMNRVAISLLLSAAVAFQACSPEYLLGGTGGSGSTDTGSRAGDRSDAGPNGGGPPAGNLSDAGPSGGVPWQGDPSDSELGPDSSVAYAGRGGSSSSANAGTAGYLALGGRSGSVMCSTGIRTGGDVNPCLAQSGASPSAQCHAYQLIGAYWNRTSTTEPCIESVDQISPSTGTAIERGLLADLNTWSTEAFVESVDGLRVYAIGETVDRTPNLYVLDLSTGLTTVVPVAANYVLAGALASGRLLGVFWNGQAEVVHFIDPRNGSFTLAGTLTGLTWWGSQIVLDRAKNRVYALGQADQTSPTQLYTLDLADRSVSTQLLDWRGFFGGVTSSGLIVAADVYGAGWSVATIDPLTAEVTRRGTFLDLSGMGYLVFDPTRNVAHTVSFDSSQDRVSYLFSVNLTSGASTKLPTGQPYQLAKQ
jgi:hypothetical protein